MKFLREYTISTHAPAGGATEAQAGYIPCNQDFYSRPCGRGDGGGARAAHGDVVISTHAPAGGATVALSANALREVFLLTPLREGRRKRPTQNPYPSRFLLTPLREGRLIDFRTTRSAVGKFLLTPLREGRRGRCCVRIPRGKISTHAPAGGATPFGHKKIRLCGLFLLTPLREGRRTDRSRLRINLYFYSRPCGRGDLLPPVRVNGWVPISTHAPAGGATLLLPPAWRFQAHFYSRPCGRGDYLPFPCRRCFAAFLLTPLREGRLVQLMKDWAKKQISTHAPAGGATRGGKSNPLSPYFYSRPCGRGDGRCCVRIPRGKISTHAPAGGATS